MSTSTAVSTSEARIVVGVDGSRHSQQALRWGAHLADLLGARLEAVTAWDYPATYGWAAVAPGWNPGQETKKTLDDAVSATFGDQSQQDSSSKYVKAAPPRSC